MLYTILPEEMKRVERRMMDATGTASLTLMERAAAHVATVATPYLEPGGRLLLLCGLGNNAGDGLAASRLVMRRMPRLKTIIWKLPGTPGGEAAAQWEQLSAYRNRTTVVELDGGAPEVPADVTCVMDALFGIGLNRALEGAAKLAVERLNAANVPTIAVDIPSGLDGRTGYPVGWNQGGVAVRAAETVTFHRPKAGLFLGEGLDCCGKVTVCDIGIAAEWDDAAGMAVCNRGDRLLPARRRNTHKGSYGRVLVLGGSVGMAGAAALCATAALRAGAGLVTVACPSAILPVVQTLCPCATCLPLPEQDPQAAWEILSAAMTRADALVAGCGLGRSELAAALMAKLISALCRGELPAVLDADALNEMADSAQSASQSGALRLPDCVTLTPHVGEAARLLNQPVSQVETEQAAAARALCQKYGGSVVLKSASSVLAAADGEAINLFGTAAVAVC